MSAADKVEKLKLYRTKLQRLMKYFQVSKINIPPGLPEYKIDAVEERIQRVVSSFKPGKPSLQHQQVHEHFLPHSISHLHSMQPQSQFLIPQINLQASATSVQPSTVQNSFMPRLQQSGVQTTLQMVNIHGSNISIMYVASSRLISNRVVIII
ncbi:hypothetical protein SUGI_1016570 [Cryptomeria japonica]|nr:hypothetical protein SUGI_1016570 [Cryptomeria japonica]